MNNDLKEKTPFNTKLSFLIAIVVTIIACFIVPAVEQKPYTPKVEAAIQVVDLPPQLQQLREPPPPPKAQMPVPAQTDAEIEKATIERTDFTGMEKIEKQPQIEPQADVYNLLDVEVKPVIIQKYWIDAEYPEWARKAGIEGTVIIECILDTAGTVIDAKVMRGIHPLLDESALKASRRLRFTPAKRRDKTVKVKVMIPIKFSLEGEE